MLTSGGRVDHTLTPGAAISTESPQLENSAIFPLSSEAPTPSVLSQFAGIIEGFFFVAPEFPLDTTVNTPWSRTQSNTVWLISSQGAGAPSDMLITFAPRCTASITLA